MRSLDFYEWLFGTENVSGLSRNARQGNSEVLKKHPKQFILFASSSEIKKHLLKEESNPDRLENFICKEVFEI